MEQNQLLEGRIRDLAGKAYNNDYATHTEFLAASDLALFYQILRKQGVNPESHQVQGVPFVIYGFDMNHDEAAKILKLIDEDLYVAGSFGGSGLEISRYSFWLKN